MKWISVNEYLPGLKVEYYIIVRYINSALTEFYAMANYCQESASWDFFIESIEEEEIKVTHWLIPDEVLEEDYFIKEGGTVIR